jgi:hypothetical protein
MMQITATTDGRFVGLIFDEASSIVILDDDVSVQIDRVMEIPGGKRFINSSYIIDAQGA